jgi:hypothetical protein
MGQTAANIWAGFLAVVVLIGLFKAIAGEALAPPPDWLVEWTGWVGTVVTILLAPIVAGAAAKALRRLG